MWLSQEQFQKFRVDSLEGRICAAAMNNALANPDEEIEEIDAQVDALWNVMSWLYGMNQKLVVQMIADEWGVTTSPSALSRFWDKFCGPFLSARMKKSSAAAKALREDFNLRGANAKVGHGISETFFDLVSSPNPDPDKLVKLAKEIRQASNSEREWEKFDEFKRKAEMLDSLKDNFENENLSEDEKANRMREVFGIF